MKLDKRVIIKILTVAVFVVAIGAIMMFIKLNHKPVDPDSLPKYDSPVSVLNIVSSGDVNGGYYKVSVFRKNNNALIVSESNEKADYPVKHQQYTVSSELLDKIEEMFYRNGMIKWPENDDKKHSSSDSVGYTLTFIFGEETTTFSSAKIPNRNNSLSELFSLIQSYEKNDNSEAVLKDVFNENGLNIFNLKNGYIDAEIVNNGSSDKSFPASFELYKSVKGEWEKITPLNDTEDNVFEVKAGTGVPVQFDLNKCGKLEAGEYRIICEENDAEFSIG